MREDKLLSLRAELVNRGAVSVETEEAAVLLMKDTNAMFAEDEHTNLEAVYTGRPGLWQVVLRTKPQKD
jgi:hypothetical protein